jgi:hypothetical protein
MAAPWPSCIVNSFQLANQPQFAHNQNAYYGPYNKLLHHLFGVLSPFSINPPYYTVPEPLRTKDDLVSLFTVEYKQHPVLFIEIKSPASFKYDSRRREADERMRGCFRDLRQLVVTPSLPGISAFGTRMAFYEFVAATNSVTPPAIAAHPSLLNDVAPADRWGCDLLEPDGIARMRQVVQNVQDMCQALEN